LLKFLFPFFLAKLILENILWTFPDPNLKKNEKKNPKYRYIKIAFLFFLLFRQNEIKIGQNSPLWIGNNKVVIAPRSLDKKKKFIDPFRVVKIQN